MTEATGWRLRRRSFSTRAGIFAAGFLLVASFALVRWWDPVPVEVLRLKGFDVLQRLDPRTAADGATDRWTGPVVIVDIDEESLDRIGQWPWPRSVIAELVDRLAEGGALAIGFDVLFAEPDRLSPEALADRIQRFDTELARELRFLPGNDARLAQSFRRHTRVVVAQAVHPRALPHDIGPVNTPSVAVMGPTPEAALVQAPGVIRPLPRLADAAAGVGMISLWESPDNIVRRVPLAIQAAGDLYPALSSEMLRVALGEKTYVLQGSSAGAEALLIGPNRIPVDASGQIWVHYRSSNPHQYISAQDVLAGDLPSDTFRNRFVLVGASATGLGDIKATPMTASLPGVEVHAQALETVLDGTVLRRPAIAEAVEIAATLALGSAVVVLIPLAGAWTALVLGGVLAFAAAGAAGYAYSVERVMLDAGFPLVTSFFAFTLMVFGNYLVSDREKRFIRGAFNQYLAPALVDQIAHQPELLKLGGETRPATILFSDIRGFTGIAERFGDDAAGLTNLVNRLLTPLSEEILLRKGTIDKYIGDAIMAFWNAPMEDPVHAENACEAALAMVRALDALNRELAAEAGDGGTPLVLRTGIGINTGRCLAGNLGSRMRFNYSVLGDAVNIAARLEALTRTYDVDIIIGETTAAAVRDRYAVVELDEVQLKGRQEPAKVFALLGNGTLAADTTFLSFAAAHQRLRDSLVAGRDQAARSLLDELGPAAEAYGLGAVYAMYADRLGHVTPRLAAPVAS